MVNISDLIKYCANTSMNSFKSTKELLHTEITCYSEKNPLVEKTTPIWQAKMSGKKICEAFTGGRQRNTTSPRMQY